MGYLSNINFDLISCQTTNLSMKKYEKMLMASYGLHSQASKVGALGPV